MTLFLLMGRVLATRARKSNRLAVLAVLALPTSALAMDAGRALNHFTGHTISGEYANGGTFIEQFRDGGATIYADDSGIVEGRATVDGPRLCFAYPGNGLTGGCFVVQRQGDNCFTFFSADDTAISPLWTARAWRTDAASTCEDVPVG